MTALVALGLYATAMGLVIAYSEFTLYLFQRRCRHEGMALTRPEISRLRHAFWRGFCSVGYTRRR